MENYGAKTDNKKAKIATFIFKPYFVIAIRKILGTPLTIN